MSARKSLIRNEVCSLSETVQLLYSSTRSAGRTGLFFLWVGTNRHKSSQKGSKVHESSIKFMKVHKRAIKFTKVHGLPLKVNRYVVIVYNEIFFILSQKCAPACFSLLPLCRTIEKRVLSHVPVFLLRKSYGAEV